MTTETETPSFLPEDRPAARWRLSDILRAIADDPRRDRISVGDLLELLQGRALAALLLLFALPNALPAIPGTSSILGMPLLYLSAQLMLGRTPWLPKLIAQRSMSRRDFGELVNRAEPWLARAERMLRPRLSPLVHVSAQRAIGAMCLVMSVILVMPIPLGNMLPAFAICLLALGIMERDGVWIIAGTASFAAALLIVGGVVYALVRSAVFLIVNAVA